MKFTKMQGCGNDYIYVNGFEEQGYDKEELVRALSDRHFGIGGDGVIFINPSSHSDFEMEMFNADGSRSQMCGNGIRCVGKYVYDHGMTESTQITVESFGKQKKLNLTVKDGKVRYVRVDMGEPELIAAKIPVVCERELVINEEILVGEKRYQMTCVSMGNPHAVIFLDSISDSDVLQDGPLLERHVRFPERTNVEFVQVINKKRVKMRVWERGTGETLACGTGCCATTVAAILNGFTDNCVTVEVLGGEINVEWDRETNHIYMEGPAVTVFEGEVEIKGTRVDC